MSTLEATKTMLDALPEADLLVIYDVIKMYYDKSKRPLKKLTRQDILKDLAISREQIKNGEYLDADAALKEIEAKYGL